MDFEAQKIEMALEIFDQTSQGIWWKDKDLKYRLMNNTFANLLGFESSRSSYERVSDYQIPCEASELADDFERQDKYVITSKKKITNICLCKFSNGEWKLMLSHKFPKFNADNKVIGMSGTSFDVTGFPVMQTALLLLLNDEKLSSFNSKQPNQFTYMLKDTHDDFNLTKRESECLFLMVRGMTMKEAGAFLGISNKSVQKYVEYIKLKMFCSTRSELIEKALQFGAGSIIPRSILDPKNRKKKYD